VLLFDFRIHGEAIGHTPRWVFWSRRIVDAASRFVRLKAPGQPQLLWGVSMGAATALLAVRDYGGFAGVVSDSFLSRRFARRSNTTCGCCFIYRRFRSRISLCGSPG